MSSSPHSHQTVRDLAWAINSPPLVTSFRGEDALFLESDEQREMSEDLELLLAQLERDPSPLTSFLQQKGPITRLGRYFEALFEFWLTHSERYRLLYSGLQVRTQKKTVGEFDILVRDQEAGETLHWELAVKYYLYSGNALTPSDWIGPNPRDRFEDKLRHLCQHQSKLSESFAGKRRLEKLGIEVNRRLVILKGYLFRPETGAASLEGCEENPEHLRGWWRTRSVFLASEELARGDYCWSIAPRLRWMSLYDRVNTEDSYSGDEIRVQIDAELERYRVPLMVIQREDSSEVSRGIVCPDDWPSGKR